MLRESVHWQVRLNLSQNLVGKLIIVLRRHAQRVVETDSVEMVVSGAPAGAVARANRVLLVNAHAISSTATPKRRDQPSGRGVASEPIIGKLERRVS